MDAYEITVAPACVEPLRALSHADLSRILYYLDRAAAAASLPPHVHRVESLATRVHHGVHRASLGGTSIVFRVNHEHHRITLISIDDREKALTDEDTSRWKGEGGQ